MPTMLVGISFVSGIFSKLVALHPVTPLQEQKPECLELVSFITNIPAIHVDIQLHTLFILVEYSIVTAPTQPQPQHNVNLTQLSWV